MRHVRHSAVAFVLVAAICFQAPASGVGTAVVNGEALVSPCPDWDPGCEFSVPPTKLSRLTYTGGETANIVTFEYVPSSVAYQAICLGYGPGSCGAVAPPDQFVFTEAWATLYATGLCTSATTQAARCAGPDDTNEYNLFPSNAVNLLPVNVVLGGQNDDFVATNLPINPQEFAFSIDGGWGSDTIVLNDNTGHDFGSYDQISCGPGVDRVIANIDVLVASDCEQVTRLT
jgi:hypothetical protein